MFTITAKGNVIGGSGLTRTRALSSACLLSTTAYRHCVVVVTNAEGVVVAKYRKGEAI